MQRNIVNTTLTSLQSSLAVLINLNKRLASMPLKKEKWCGGRPILCPLLANSGHKVNADLSPHMPLSLCPLLTQSGH